jgi:thioredoxin 1
MADQAAEINESNFDAEVVHSDKPVLLDFWAEWCPPCKMIAPHVDNFAKEYADKVKIGKVDVDSNQSLAQRFGISAIPTLIMFKNGEAVQTIQGADLNKIKEALDAA